MPNSLLKSLELKAQLADFREINSENDYLLVKGVKDVQEHARDKTEIAIQYDRIVKEIENE